MVSQCGNGVVWWFRRWGHKNKCREKFHHHRWMKFPVHRDERTYRYADTLNTPSLLLLLLLRPVGWMNHNTVVVGRSFILPWPKHTPTNDPISLVPSCLPACTAWSSLSSVGYSLSTPRRTEIVCRSVGGRRWMGAVAEAVARYGNQWPLACYEHKRRS